VLLLSEAGKVRVPLPFRDLIISLGQADNFDLGINDMQLLLEAASFTALADPYDRLRQARVAGLPLIPATAQFKNPDWFVLCVGLRSSASHTTAP
jgi:hypothetical protein